MAVARRNSIMRCTSIIFAFILLSSSSTALAANPTSQPAIVWETWTDDLFDRAKKEDKLVILDLEAVWCHWCHVMDETTYRDELVRQLIGKKYIAVRVDQDSRPDLSNRYEDYGWPATIIFTSDGKELAKRQGYLRPMQMSSMLQAFIDDPTPGPSVQAQPTVEPSDVAGLTSEVRKQLIHQLREAYDPKQAGWGVIHKFIDADVIEFCLASGDPELRTMARDTLTAARKLIDPAWGGVYQYSTDGDWDHPHFEKIMSFQADDLRTYARASIALKDANFFQAAEDIHKFLRLFLTSPDDAFYTSQDADLVPGEHAGEYFVLNDVDRRKLGVPRVDRHIYSRENGWAIESLANLYSVTADAATLAEAERAAEWIIAHRSLDGGGFRHDEKDAAGPFLGDTLAMGRGFLALHIATGEDKWLTRAEAAASFISLHFENHQAGYCTACGSGASVIPEVDENVALVRFGNSLTAYTGNELGHMIAVRAMKYVAAPQVIGRRNWLVGGILLADQELAHSPKNIKKE